MSAVADAAGSILEEGAEEAASEGVTQADPPGIDLWKYARKVLLSTSPNPPIDDVKAEHGTDTGGAYLWRGFKKMISAIPGFGGGANPAILDVGIGTFHKATGDGQPTSFEGTGDTEATEESGFGVEPE